MKQLYPPPLQDKDKAQRAIEKLLFRGQKRLVSDSNIENKTRTRRREWCRLHEHRRIAAEALANVLKQTLQTPPEDEMTGLFAVLPICFLELGNDTSLLRSIVNSVWSTMLSKGKIDEKLKASYDQTVDTLDRISQNDLISLVRNVRV